ncbi:phosphatase PAP2 family protein [Sphingomonas sp. TDK1]|uniref:phosphatase PAP2 family protein n=1 Tax=Sphingomonas sp. TDK1 TaxID=453247 RepID=UPI0007D94B04|nr:phosphatase PAP2 family protein [Sphingomonas sp. TDK1]OAN62228.1 phosphatase [Sphingomonas sp. TDK1]
MTDRNPASATLTAPTRAFTAMPSDTRAAIGFSGGQVRGAVLCAVAACALLLWTAGLTIDPLAHSNIPYYAILATAPLLRLWCLRDGRRWGVILAQVVEYYTLFMGMALIGAVSSYPVAAMSEGFADAGLQRVDELLQFDWLAWYRTVAAHRSLQLLGIAAYQSIFLTPALLLGWFAVTGQRREAHRFLAAFAIAAVITLSIYSQMPAVGPFSYLWHGPIPYMPVSELWQPDIIPALRDHSLTVVDVGQLRGLVSAPSFHAASATLYIAAAQRCGPLRWWLTAIASAMLLSTPVEGTHYLIDLILGAGVALVAWFLATLLIRWRVRKVEKDVCA